MDEVYKAAILAARTLIEKDPAYTYATARLLLHTIRREVLGEECAQAEMAERYAEYFPQFIKKGVEPNCWTSAAAVRPGPPGRGAESPSATCSSTTSACRPCTTATSCTSTRRASSCRRPSSCAWPWAWRSTRSTAKRAPSSSTKCCRASTSCQHAHAVQQRHAALAAVELLPDHRARRPGRHLRGHQGKRAAVQVCRRPGQRLDARARAGQPHQGHQRREPGRGALPEGGQRHGRGRQPGRQAQGRGLRLPGDLAPRHRGVPGAAQEHRRRPPPHARHEHRQLDSRPVHAPRDGEKASGRCSRPATCPTCTTSSAPTSSGLRGLRSQGRRGEIKLFKDACRHRPVAQDADHAVRDRPSLDHLQGRLQRALARSSTWRGALVQPVHRDHAQHQRHRNAVCNLGSVNLRST
jgi:hypothetical protein